jgi:hypothetical protein
VWLGRVARACCDDGTGSLPRLHCNYPYLSSRVAALMDRQRRRPTADDYVGTVPETSKRRRRTTSDSRASPPPRGPLGTTAAGSTEVVGDGDGLVDSSPAEPQVTTTGTAAAVGGRLNPGNGNSAWDGCHPSLLLSPVGVPTLPAPSRLLGAAVHEPNRRQLLPHFAVPSALMQPASHQLVSMLQHRQLAGAPDGEPWNARLGAGEPNRMFLMRRGGWDRGALRRVADPRLPPWFIGAPWEPAMPPHPHPHLPPHGAAASGASILRSPSAGFSITDCLGMGPAALSVVPEFRWGIREAVAAAAHRGALLLPQAALASSSTGAATSTAFAMGRFGLASSYAHEDAVQGLASSAFHGPTVPDAAARNGKSAHEPGRGGAATTHGPCRSIPMASREADAKDASRYQCLLREQIEYFEADDADLRAKAQGRNVPIQPRQVGIRCVHCARRNQGSGESSDGEDPGQLVKLEREIAMSTRGAVYYPATLSNLYQAVQNMANNHFVNRTCPSAPSSLIDEILEARRTRPKRSGGKGKTYFVQSAEGAGIADASEGSGLVFVARASPEKAIGALSVACVTTTSPPIEGQSTANVGMRILDQVSGTGRGPSRCSEMDGRSKWPSSL